jgi:hypothetical protein
MSDLRNHLFETLEALKDNDAPMDLARAKAISDVAQTIVNSAKVEVDLLKQIGAPEGSEFFDHLIETPTVQGPRMIARGRD